MQQRSAGFTMVELMTCIAVLSTVAAMAVPGFSSLMARQRISSAGAELHTALMLARSEALDRGKQVALCPSTDGEACNSSHNWSHGYLLFIDLDGDRMRQSNEPVLQRMDPQATVQISSNVGRPVIIFHDDGSAAGFNTTFSLCSPGRAEPAVTLVLSNSGRLRSGSGAGAPCAT